ncbi:MAG: DUF2066 domain-containing protein [Gammaproteobacteria bacterium]|nr:DUF2066 domain-containing protein [Gammaproteobacteria bacterium]
MPLITIRNLFFDMLRKIHHFYFSFIVLLLFSAYSHAAIVEDLYTIELAVADQSTSLRLSTFKKAFADIIVKVSGSDAPLSAPAFKRPLSNATRYVKQFSYYRSEVIADELEEGQLILKIEFTQRAIEALLRGSGFPVWGKVRPSILFVMSVQVNENHQLVSEESAPELIEYMDELSIKHGLPTQFPLLDLEDRAVLNYSEAALSNLESVNTLGFRYQSDVVLIGEMIGVSGEGWKGLWQSQFSGQVFKWESKASTKENVMSKAVAHLAQLLAQEYALGSVKENKNTVIVDIDDLTSLQSYQLVSRYFSSLAVVEKVQVKTVTPQSASFYLTLRNSPDELHRLIDLGDVLEQVDLPVIDASEEQPDDLLSFTYRLL